MAERKPLEPKGRVEKMKNLPQKLLSIISEEMGSEGVSVEDLEEITSEMINKWKSLRIVPVD